jgi:uncharacterized protein YndB with AHSA1/START domain
MTIPIFESDMTLKVKRVFHAPREKVFAAWTQPDLLKQWLGGGNIPDPVAEVDLRIGGQYRVQLRAQDSPVFWVTGTYQEITPPERLVYTWQFEGTEMDTGETLVTVEFFDRGDATEVVMLHERFPNHQVRDVHGEGWTMSFDNLATFLDG